MKAICVALAVAGALVASAVSRSNASGQVSTGGSIGYFIASGNTADGFHASDRELAAWAIEAWQRTLGGAVRLSPQPEADALIRVYWAGPLEGRYGEMQPLAIGNRRGAAVYIRPDTDSLGEDIAARARRDPLLRDTIVYLTCLHETGHALGLRHTSDFRDIMYFFGYGGDIVGYFDRYRAQLRNRGDIATIAGLSDADIRTVRRLFSRP